jgi:hypothetical protein
VRSLLSLSRGPRSLACSPVRPFALDSTWALPVRPVLLLCNRRAHGVHPAHVTRALGKDLHTHPGAELFPPRFTILPSPHDFCKRFGHGELHLNLVHQEPAVVSPFLNSTTRSVLSIFPAQVGVRRHHDPSTSSQPEPPRTVPSRPKRCLRVSGPPSSLFCTNFASP